VPCEASSRLAKMDVVFEVLAVAEVTKPTSSGEASDRSKETCHQQLRDAGEWTFYREGYDFFHSILEIRSRDARNTCEIPAQMEAADFENSRDVILWRRAVANHHFVA
jgi:hypothetical protein